LNGLNSDFILNPKLSWRAKGIVLGIIVLNKKKENINILKLARFSSEGKDTVRNTINDLIEKGFLIRKAIHSPQGRISKWDYTITNKCLNRKEVING